MSCPEYLKLWYSVKFELPMVSFSKYICSFLPEILLLVSSCNVLYVLVCTHFVITPFSEVEICREVFNVSEFHFSEVYFFQTWYFSKVKMFAICLKKLEELHTLWSMFSCTVSIEAKSNWVRLCIEKTMAAIIPFCSTGGKVAALRSWHINGIWSSTFGVIHILRKVENI